MQLKQFYLLKLVAEKSATTFGDLLDSSSLSYCQQLCGQLVTATFW